eukprot:gnl/MRDRNA2_/MRDRNA2_110327_c0_seq1.p1 gnl/MRDRNA2_/MRDRNA2_110327_c0~~gnl/MRDRNA2_/MRDRNA2_110327_c0_seq1.p1  ORF type:complete len:406 (-),score=88.11 gnl/MRDRNA2_/MRDRNA2_110327_c0_seq1:214-1431(-)
MAMIAVIMAPEQMYPSGQSNVNGANNVDMVEVMVPPVSWGCAPLTASSGTYAEHSGYYNTWSNSPQDCWGTEDWVHTPQSNGSPQHWMPATQQVAISPTPSSASPDWPQRQIQASVADDAAPIGMRMQLQALQAKDPGSVLIARKLHRLGFNSAQKLQEHFSQYGAVKEVLVPHSRVKASPGRRARTRPAAIGFIVMSSSEAAAAVIEQGNEHMIEGIQINVQAFQRRIVGGSQDGSSEDGSYEDGSSKINSEESSDQEAKLRFGKDERVSTPETIPSTPRSASEYPLEYPATPSPKARWADISEEEDKLQLPFQALQQYDRGRWEAPYGDEGERESPPRSPSPFLDYAPKVVAPPEQNASRKLYYNKNNQVHNQKHQPCRRHNSGRGIRSDGLYSEHGLVVGRL